MAGRLARPEKSESHLPGKPAARRSETGRELNEELRKEGGGFAEIDGSGRSCSGIRYLTYDVSRRSG